MLVEPQSDPKRSRTTDIQHARLVHTHETGISALLVDTYEGTTRRHGTVL
jgi:hypothetical protein